MCLSIFKRSTGFTSYFVQILIGSSSRKVRAASWLDGMLSHGIGDRIEPLSKLQATGLHERTYKLIAWPGRCGLSMPACLNGVDRVPFRSFAGAARRVWERAVASPRVIAAFPPSQPSPASGGMVLTLCRKQRTFPGKSMGRACVSARGRCRRASARAAAKRIACAAWRGRNRQSHGALRASSWDAC
jgi:hypothetical protein